MASYHPTLISVVTGAASPGQISFTWPGTVQSDDLLLVIIRVGWRFDMDNVTTPPGWTRLIVRDVELSDITTWVFYRMADGSEAYTTTTFTKGRGDSYVSGEGFVFRGAIEPVAESTTLSATSSLVWPTPGFLEGDVVLWSAHHSASAPIYPNTHSAGILGFRSTGTRTRGFVAISGVREFGDPLQLNASASANWVLVTIAIDPAEPVELSPAVYTTHKVSGESSITIAPPPSATSDDTLIVSIVGDQPVTPPSGWTPLITPGVGGSGAYRGAWYAPNPGSATTWSFASAANANVVVVATDQEFSDPFAITLTPPGTGGESGATVAVPNPTNIKARDTLVVVGGLWPSSGQELYGVAKSGSSSYSKYSRTGSNSPLSGPVMAYKGGGNIELVMTDAAGEPYGDTNVHFELIGFRLKAPSQTFIRAAFINANPYATAELGASLDIASLGAVLDLPTASISIDSSAGINLVPLSATAQTSQLAISVEHALTLLGSLAEAVVDDVSVSILVGLASVVAEASGELAISISHDTNVTALQLDASSSDVAIRQAHAVALAPITPIARVDSVDIILVAPDIHVADLRLDASLDSITISMALEILVQDLRVDAYTPTIALPQRVVRTVRDYVADIRKVVR